MKRWMVVCAMMALSVLVGAQDAPKKKAAKGGKGKSNAGFVRIFNGKDLSGWTGNTTGYKVADGAMTWESGGNIYTEKEYSDFHLKLDFNLTPGANNGVGIRAPLTENAAYGAMEIQVLDDPHPKYATIKVWQHTGSIYGVVPAKTGSLKPAGEWNHMEIVAVGPKIKVMLNDAEIVNADISEFYDKPTIDGKEHPGLKKESGHIGFLGHGSVLSFRNISIKDLSQAAPAGKGKKGGKKNDAAAPAQ